MIVAQVVWGLVGAVTVVGVVASAVRTVVLPRGVPARLARLVFVAVEAVFRVGAAHSGPSPAGSDPLSGYRRVDRRYAAVGPIYLLVLLASWLVTIAAGFIGVIEACRPQPLAHAAALSGSSLTTLGVVAASGVDATVAIVEAAVGLTVVALLITYLPALHGAFARREATVAMLSVRGGVPAHGPDLLAQQYRADRLFSAPALFTEWAGWFVDIAESHTSFPVLVWYRSPQPLRSWPSAAGCVLDAAALCLSALRPSPAAAGQGVDPAELVPAAELCIRAGVQALRRIADFQGIEAPECRSVLLTEDQFAVGVASLAANGLPVRPAPEAWPYFRAWRVSTRQNSSPWLTTSGRLPHRGPPTWVKEHATAPRSSARPPTSVVRLPTPALCLPTSPSWPDGPDRQKPRLREHHVGGFHFPGEGSLLYPVPPPGSASLRPACAWPSSATA